MNKFHIISFVAILAIFVGILSATQGNSMKNIFPSAITPVLPNDADTFQMISPGANKMQMEQGPEGPKQDVQGQKAQANPTFGVEEGVKASYSATIKTTRGDIKAIISGKAAPRTVKNFIEKAEKGFYKNLTFHRVEDWVVQGGDPKGNGTGGGLMQTELNDLPFVAGSLGIARGGDIRVSNDSQFFITKIESPHLNQQYTNFGLVIEGMDVVNSMKVGDKILGITIE